MARRIISATVVKTRIPQKEKVKPYTVISWLMPSTMIVKNFAKNSKPVPPYFINAFTTPTTHMAAMDDTMREIHSSGRKANVASRKSPNP